MPEISRHFNRNFNGSGWESRFATQLCFFGKRAQGKPAIKHDGLPVGFLASISMDVGEQDFFGWMAE